MLDQPTFSERNVDWYHITVRDGVEASELQQKIKDIFLKFFTTAGSKESMGIFLRHDILQQTTTFYFTPTAAAVAKIFGAFSCQPPQKLGITLLTGPDTCWNLFCDID